MLKSLTISLLFTGFFSYELKFLYQELLHSKSGWIINQTFNLFFSSISDWSGSRFHIRFHLAFSNHVGVCTRCLNEDRPCQARPAPQLRFLCPKPMWPHPATKSWDSEQGPGRLQSSASVLRWAGPLFLQLSFHIAAEQKTFFNISEMLMPPKVKSCILCFRYTDVISA